MITQTNVGLNQSISYYGKVTVKIQKGDKIISTKTSHNEGKAALFDFLIDCLNGSYLKDNRPTRVRVFRKLDGETVEVPNFSTTTVLCPGVYLDGLPTVDRSYTNKRTITYHFRIPFTILSLGQVGDTAGFCKLALYSNENSDDSNIGKPSAVFLFTTTDAAGNTVWEPIEIDNKVNSNYSIIIDWSLTLGNSSIEQTTVIDTTNPETNTNPTNPETNTDTTT